jgi:hypothetical protein
MRRRERDDYAKCPVWALCTDCGFQTDLTARLPQRCPRCRSFTWGDRVIRLPKGTPRLPSSFLRRGADGYLYLGVSQETLAGLVLQAQSGELNERQYALVRRMTLSEEWAIAARIHEGTRQMSRMQ